MSLKRTQRRKLMDRASIKAMAKQQIKGNVAMLFVISLIVLSLNLFGDGLRDAFDPKLNV